MMSKYDILYSYFIHYNPYKKRWFAVLREDTTNYMNGKPVKVMFKGKTVKNLVKNIINGK